jgi:hypothetical protein
VSSVAVPPSRGDQEVQLSADIADTSVFELLDAQPRKRLRQSAEPVVVRSSSGSQDSFPETLVELADTVADTLLQ